jgi:AraC-like DNA-binding protein
LIFKDYIYKLNIEEANRILLSSNFNILTIDAIAAKAGFNSKSAFYRSFKSITGYTPHQCIEQNKTTAKEVKEKSLLTSFVIIALAVCHFYLLTI